MLLALLCMPSVGLSSSFKMRYPRHEGSDPRYLLPPNAPGERLPPQGASPSRTGLICRAARQIRFGRSPGAICRREAAADRGIHRAGAKQPLRCNDWLGLENCRYSECPPLHPRYFVV